MLLMRMCIRVKLGFKSSPVLSLGTRLDRDMPLTCADHDERLCN